MTLDVAGSVARFVDLDDASGVKRCLDLDVRVLASTLVAPTPFEDEVETWAFLATRVDANTVRWTNDAEVLTLRRRTGAITSSRTLTDSVGFGSLDPYLFAAASDDRFYGTCRCGRNDRFTDFDLATDTALDQIDTEATGTHLSIRFGYFDPSVPPLVVGGTGLVDVVEETPNRLATFDPVTFAVTGVRDVLPTARVDDVAWVGDRLVALLGEGARFGDMAVVGADGRATETYALPGAFEGFARGIAGVGDVLYVITEDFATDRVLLYAVELD